MDGSKKHASTAQVNALMDFMQDPSKYGNSNNMFEKQDSDARWKDFAETLNSMGGAVKSIDKWKQTGRDLKSNSKKRALKHQMNDSPGLSSDCGGDILLNMDSDSTPNKKCCSSSFDDEIIKIERDKLEFEREYKIQKIEVLARIASALEELAKKQ